MKKLIKYLFYILILTVFLLFVFRDNFYKYIPGELKNKVLNNWISDNYSELLEDNSLTGFDKAEGFSSKYYFKGNNVNNYFLYNSFCFRIVNIAANDSVKLIYAGYSEDNTCSDLEILDSKMSYNGMENSEFNESDIYKMYEYFLEENKLFEKNFNYDIVLEANWYTSGIKMSGNRLSENIDYERGKYEEEYSPETHKLGLISITDYLKAGCEKSVYDAIESCGKDNYLFSKNDYYTMSRVLWDTTNIYTVTNGMPKPMLTTNGNYHVLPSFYIKGDLIVIGDGTVNSPYKLK